jgi:hypothetical protein
MGPIHNVAIHELVREDSVGPWRAERINDRVAGAFR